MGSNKRINKENSGQLSKKKLTSIVSKSSSAEKVNKDKDSAKKLQLMDNFGSASIFVKNTNERMFRSKSK